MSRLFRGRRILQKHLYEYAIQEGIISPEVDEAGDAIDLDSYRERRKKTA